MLSFIFGDKKDNTKLINSAIQNNFAIVKFETTVITPAAEYPATLRVIGIMKYCCYVISL